MMKNQKKEASFMVGSNSRHPPNNHVMALPCELVADGSGEEMVKQFFGPVCQALRNCYGSCRCHKICRMFENDYRQIYNHFNPIAAKSIKQMDEQLILLDDSQWEDIVFNARNQAQILEIDSQYNAYWTRKNFLFSKHHKITVEDLVMNFFKHEAPLDFPIRWKRMLDEICHKDDNRHYAWEKFHDSQPGANPNLKELFWTYRFGRAIELFGIQHRDLFRAGHLVNT